jgi:hypothetical protein
LNSDLPWLPNLSFSQKTSNGTLDSPPMKYGSYCSLVLGMTTILCCYRLTAFSQGQVELISNPGFEQTNNGQAVGWDKYGINGYAVDNSVHHSGNFSIRITNHDESSSAGAGCTLTLNQTLPAPIQISGWSKAEFVSIESTELFTASNYTIYVDIIFTDGTPLWGQFAEFNSGTHDWERRQLLIAPNKPIAEIYVYALFRYRSGAVWFDDFSATQLLRCFDSQLVSPPDLPEDFAGAWFARDVAANSEILPLNSGVENTILHLLLKDRQSLSQGRVDSVTLQDTTGKDRAVTLYYMERFHDDRMVWWNDIRSSLPVLDGEYELKNLRRTHGGATDNLSIYPIACVTAAHYGRVVGAAVQAPRVVRTGYHAGAQILYVAFDFGLTASNVNNDGNGHGLATAKAVHYNSDSIWGFRDAIKTYFELFPEAFVRRETPDGIWMPFTNPATISNVQDFGIAYHETDPGALSRELVTSDDGLGVLTFRYSEPCDYGITMAAGAPKTYENSLAALQDAAAGGDIGAKAVLHSGAIGENGKLYVQYQDFPWLHGAKWALNNNPNFPTNLSQPSAASLTYSDHIAESQYGLDNKFIPGALDGEYIDSLENWDLLDYGSQAIALSNTPPTFSNVNFRPVVPLWMSQYELVAWMSSDLHQRRKLIIANATPINKYAFPSLLDAMGIEVDWNPGGQWSPEDDSVMNLRRTLSYQKPYLLLQNTDFSQFGSAQVQKYFERSLFYGMFPSFFSADASSNPYWENPSLYNRDRSMFKQYIPVIKSLSAAGWQPLTYARTDHPSVHIERFGIDLLTLLNDSGESMLVNVTVALSDLWPPSRLRYVDSVRVKDMVTGETLASTPISAMIAFSVPLDTQQVRALELVANGGRVDHLGPRPTLRRKWQ